MYPWTSDALNIPVAETALEKNASILWIYSFRGPFPVLSGILDTFQEWPSDIRIELQGRISSGWGGDFVQEAVRKSPLPGILSKAQGGKENQDVGLSQGSNYFWKWIWVGWDEGSVLEQVTWSLQSSFFFSPPSFPSWMFVFLRDCLVKLGFEAFVLVEFVYQLLCVGQNTLWNMVWIV